MIRSEGLPDIWRMNLGKEGEYEEKCLKEGLIRIGFDVHEDLSGKDREAIREIVDKIPGLSDRQRAMRAGMLHMFCNQMKEKDLVAVVLKTVQPGDPHLAIGRVISAYDYREDEELASAPHAREVEWITDPETPLKPNWEQYISYLRGQRTINRIKNEGTRERIRKFVKKGGEVDQGESDVDTESGEQIDDQLLPEEIAREQIASLIHERFPDKRMEELVASVLRAAGYATAPAVDGADQGVDVIAGGGPLGFGEPRICVQVKHQSKRTDAAAVQQLVGAVKQFGAKQGLFVSWGGYTSEAERESRKCFFRIRLWDANDLIDAVCEHYANLPDEIRAAIPLRQVWTVAPEPID